MSGEVTHDASSNLSLKKFHIESALALLSFRYNSYLLMYYREERSPNEELMLLGAHSVGHLHLHLHLPVS